MSQLTKEIIFSLNVVMLGVLTALLYQIFWLYTASILLGWLWLLTAHAQGFKSLPSLILIATQILLVNIIQPDSYLFTAFIFIPVLIYVVGYGCDKLRLMSGALVLPLASIALFPGEFSILLVKYERVMQAFSSAVSGGSI
jgi:hypothetical protein